MDDAIKDGIRDRRLPDDVMPSLDGQLTGDHGRAATITFFDNLHQIAALRGRQPVWSPIIEDQQLCFRDAAEQAGKAPVTMGQFQFFEEARHSLVDHGDTVATGRLCQGTAEPGFADATGARDDQIALVGDPFAGEQALERDLVRNVSTTLRQLVFEFRLGSAPFSLAG